jgi:hypothetical protein
MQNGNGHSADVRMALLLNERRLPIAQLGPDFLFLVSPASYPPGIAEVHLAQQKSRAPELESASIWRSQLELRRRSNQRASSANSSGDRREMARSISATEFTL